MKNLFLFFLVIHHSQAENDELIFQVIVCVFCIIMLFTWFRPNKQLRIIRDVKDGQIARIIAINLYIWAMATFGTYITIKKIINY